MNNLLALFSSIRWQDIVDIVLVSYIVFRLYILFRGTNVFRVLIGIVFLWVFHRIAVSLGLIVTSWAIQGIMAVAALIIIVVFRKEIRSVLQAKNLKALLWDYPRKTAETPVDIIVESAYELARSRSGGLIVFPGKEDLQEVLHSGIPWGGSVSKEMIVSVFWHDNPVHDGAAVIKGDRVQEVGVVLPLSHRKDLPSYYGTRHRAAAGLAETTDALVIVVSEERGDVTVALGSSMRVIKRKDDLARILRGHAGVSSEQGGHLSKQKLELGIAALASVLFITSVWFSFARGLDTLVTLETPVEYMNRDPAMEILNTSVNGIRLHLSGSDALIKSIRPEQVKVRLDLSKSVVGPNTFSIAQKNISLPPGVLLKKAEPSSVEVTLDHLRRKELPIQVDWVGKLPEGLILTEARLDPKKIEFIGGKKILEGISTAYTEQVSLGAIQNSGRMTVNLALNPASIRVAPGSKDKVTVEYVVTRRVE
jgi:diadenylate cyclase